MKKIIRKIKNCILKGTAMLASVTFIISACCVDSESWIPVIAGALALLYLTAYGCAKGIIDTGRGSRW